MIVGVTVFVGVTVDVTVLVGDNEGVIVTVGDAVILGVCV